MQTPRQVVAYFCFELDSYELFIEISERNWLEEHEKYIHSLLDDAEAELKRFNYRTDLSSKLNEELPQYQRKSHLIMLVSIFEDFMNQLCRSVEHHLNLKICFTDLDGAGIERAKKYLSKHSPLSLPVSGTEWNTIKEAQKIRNIIAHAAGHIDEKLHSKEISIIRRSKTLEAEYCARTHLKIEGQHILDLIASIKSFSSKLLEECGKIA
jgi:hypothetical protein